MVLLKLSWRYVLASILSSENLRCCCRDNSPTPNDTMVYCRTAKRTGGMRLVKAPQQLIKTGLIDLRVIGNVPDCSGCSPDWDWDPDWETLVDRQEGAVIWAGEVLILFSVLWNDRMNVWSQIQSKNSSFLKIKCFFVKTDNPDYFNPALKKCFSSIIIILKSAFKRNVWAAGTQLHAGPKPRPLIIWPISRRRSICTKKPPTEDPLGPVHQRELAWPQSSFAPEHCGRFIQVIWSWISCSPLRTISTGTVLGLYWALVGHVTGSSSAELEF